MLREIEKKELEYIGIIANNRKVKIISPDNIVEEKRIDEIALSLPNLLEICEMWVISVKVFVDQ